MLFYILIEQLDLIFNDYSVEQIILGMKRSFTTTDKLDLSSDDIEQLVEGIIQSYHDNLLRFFNEKFIFINDQGMIKVFRND